MKQTFIPSNIGLQEKILIDKLIDYNFNGSLYPNEFYDTDHYNRKVVYLLQKEEHIDQNIVKLGSSQAWIGKNGRENGYKTNIQIRAMLPTYDHKKTEYIIRELMKNRYKQSQIGYDYWEY